MLVFRKASLRSLPILHLSRSSSSLADKEPSQSSPTSASGNPKRVTIERHPDFSSLAVVTLNRGKKYNSLDLAMFDGIVEAAETVRGMSGVRAVVLRGDGKVFCAGLDVKSMGSNPVKNLGRLLHRPEGRLVNLAQEVAWVWRELPLPVIAVTHGICFGGGLQIALGADFRFSTADCEFSIMEAKWGLVPDMSGSVLLRELVSIDVAKELTMTARVFSGAQAKEYGLVSHVSETPYEDAVRLAQEIAERSPDAVSGAKLLFNSTWDAPEPRALELETEIQKKLLGPLKNTMAAASQGLKLPKAVQLSFKDRQAHWRGTTCGTEFELKK